MNRRQFILAGGTAAVGAVAGCIGRAQETNTESPSESTVRVSESGEVSAEPDIAIVDVAVQSTGDDAESVRRDLAERSTALRDALIEFGIPEDDITTGRFHIHERRDERVPPREGGDGAPTVRYQGVHSLTVEVDADDAGSVVDTAVEAGADDVGRITFTLSEKRREGLREEATQLAIENARTHADLIAAEVDGRIVGVKSVDAAGGGVRAAYAEAADGDAGSPEIPTELHPDDVTVTARIEIVYRLETN